MLEMNPQKWSSSRSQREKVSINTFFEGSDRVAIPYISWWQGIPEVWRFHITRVFQKFGFERRYLEWWPITSGWAWGIIGYVSFFKVEKLLCSEHQTIQQWNHEVLCTHDVYQRWANKAMTCMVWYGQTSLFQKYSSVHRYMYLSI